MRAPAYVREGSSRTTNLDDNPSDEVAGVQTGQPGSGLREMKA